MRAVPIDTVERKHSMIIIGNGIAGRMAAKYFDYFDPKVYEANKSGDSSHKAIMRFRDFSIGYLLGVSLEKIHVDKAIYYKGNFVESNPMMLNLYSRKVAKGIYPRSVRFTDSVDRFIARESFRTPLANYEHKLEKVEPHECCFANGECVEYDVCISTIPLPVMAKAAGLDCGKTKIESYPIYVKRFKVEVSSEVYQTIYFPDGALSVYRASLEGQDLIIESQSEHTIMETPEICSAFGLHMDDLYNEQNYVQDNGKIVDMDDSFRKKLIMELTEKFSIYSLGRYATWRNITSDVLLDDLPKIAGFMKLSDSARKYTMRLESIE